MAVGVLSVLETLLSYFQQLEYIVTKFVIHLFPLIDPMVHFQLIMPLQPTVEFLQMLFSQSPQQLIVLELRIQPPSLLLLLIVHLSQLPVLYDDGLVLPCSPNFILDLLLLLGCLLEIEHQFLLSPLEFYQTLVLALVHYHHPSLLIPLLPIVVIPV